MLEHTAVISAWCLACAKHLETPRDHRAQPCAANSSLKQMRACHGSSDVLHEMLKKLWTVTVLALKTQQGIPALAVGAGEVTV